MTQRSDESAEIPITVRYFAAARAAAGAESETITVHPGATVAVLVDGLAERDTQLATVLSRCSYLCDGMAVRGDAAITRRLRAGETIDVLPPFAGG
ncbi:MAG: MoaD/ThiS family protein [Mycobacterium sp.]